MAKFCLAGWRRKGKQSVWLAWRQRLARWRLGKPGKAKVAGSGLGTARLDKEYKANASKVGTTTMYGKRALVLVGQGKRRSMGKVVDGLVGLLSQAARQGQGTRSGQAKLP